MNAVLPRSTDLSGGSEGRRRRMMAMTRGEVSNTERAVSAGLIGEAKTANGGPVFTRPPRQASAELSRRLRQMLSMARKSRKGLGFRGKV